MGILLASGGDVTPGPVRPGELGVAVSFTGGRAVLAVRGELDLCTLPALRSVLDALIDGGHRDVVLDLAALEFMDAGGLGVIVGALGRLRASGGALSLRSASAMVCRILAITGLDHIVPMVGADAPRPDPFQ
jgi:anti-anti-sigma factor